MYAYQSFTVGPDRAMQDKVNMICKPDARMFKTVIFMSSPYSRKINTYTRVMFALTTF